MNLSSYLSDRREALLVCFSGGVLFSVLCRSLKEIGASYMTLFTGETNPARYIYQSAGFKIVKTWADMEKKIK